MSSSSGSSSEDGSDSEMSATGAASAAVGSAAVGASSSDAVDLSNTTPAGIAAEEERKVRLQTWKLQKPSRGKHILWAEGFFKKYSLDRLSNFAVCMLCKEAGLWSSAEVKYGANKATTNLLNHLLCDKPKHREAYDICQGNATSKGQAKIVDVYAAGLPKETERVCRWLISQNQPLSAVEKPAFRDMVRAFGCKVTFTRRDIMNALLTIEKDLQVDLAGVLAGQHVSSTVDTWTDSRSRTYTGETYAFIDNTWTMRAISPYCQLHEGTLTGEDPATFVEKSATKHKLAERMVALVTADCEPAMVKAGRIFEKNKVVDHVGCAAHRLQSSAGKVYTGSVMVEVLGRCRKTIARYKNSSQASARLKECCIKCGIKPLQMLQDVPTRWSATSSCVGRLLEDKDGIQLHEFQDENMPSILTALDWVIMKKIIQVLSPLARLQTILEGEAYVTGSLVIPLVKDLRDDLKMHAESCVLVEDDGEEELSELEVSARAALTPCVNALLDDVTDRWGDGTAVTTYREGKRRQPGGFTKMQVIATACDPRVHQTLYGIPEVEHDKVWDMVVDAITEMDAKEKDMKAKESAGDGAGAGVKGTVDATAGQAAAAPAAAAAAAAGAGGASSPNPKRHKAGGLFEGGAGGFFSVGKQTSAGGRSAGVENTSGPIETTSESTERLRYYARLEVNAFRKTEGISILVEKKNKKGEVTKILNDPLPWWQNNERQFPQLAKLARRVLAIPATSAQSERLFSLAGLVVTKKRSRLGSKNVALLLFLRTVWPIIDDMNKATATANASNGVS